MNDKAGTRRRRLQGFVLGSVLVHGLVLAGWGTAARFGGEGQTVLSVTFATNAREARPALARPATRTTNDDTMLNRPHNVTAKTHALLDESTTMKHAMQDNTVSRDTRRDTSPTAATSGTDVAGTEARARIEAQLHTSLARHFDYPYVARLRGWEGSVLLAFIVQASGNLNDIRIVRSSGFAVLDDSAVDSLKKVQRLPEAVAWLQGRDIEMQLPVIYRLKGEH
ncbi:MAG: energy transducer TonB [Gammaproteobacteria bacterium]|nr:energy transducer TonB [Gammaproteobacteria bacterium]